MPERVTSCTGKEDEEECSYPEVAEGCAMEALLPTRMWQLALRNQGRPVDDGNIEPADAPAASPPERSNHVMAFDAKRGRVVLYGGQSDSALPLSICGDFL